MTWVNLVCVFIAFIAGYFLIRFIREVITLVMYLLLGVGFLLISPILLIRYIVLRVRGDYD